MRSSPICASSSATRSGARSERARRELADGVYLEWARRRQPRAAAAHAAARAVHRGGGGSRGVARAVGLAAHRSTLGTGRRTAHGNARHRRRPRLAADRAVARCGDAARPPPSPPLRSSASYCSSAIAWRCGTVCAAGARPAGPPTDCARCCRPSSQQVPAEIRIVENSNVAAASGYLAPTIWIGDRYVGERRRLTVIHEMWHVRSRDPLWLASIAAVRRAYWWNPLVAYLARQAVLMIESTCDHRSAEHFDKSRYITELAALLLADATPAPRLMATVHAASLNVQRLRLLGARLRLRARDVVLLAALGASAAATAMTSVVEYEAMAAARRAAEHSAARHTGRRGARDLGSRRERPRQ